MFTSASKVTSLGFLNFLTDKREYYETFEIQGVKGKFQDCASKNRTGFAIYKPSTVV